MNLRHIDKGTKFMVYEELQNRAVSDEHEAIFRYFESDRLIVFQCPWLHENYDRLTLGSKLSINYDEGSEVHTFTGRIHEKLRGNGLVMIEQLTEVETKSRRQFDRDEIRVNVSVYGLPEAKLSSTVFDRPQAAPDLTDVSFDISSGGLCVVTNSLLNSKFDPYFLVSFSFSDKDTFLIPSRVVRKSNYPRTKIGRYDYGFQFIFDNMPDEKARLTRAILSKKLSHR
ncbi:MAG: PilZ domain-containing protein [Oscillospiraceae bacterium]|nr:PilZ domain-containing protein [Oscillospiraceae bacterium]